MKKIDWNNVEEAKDGRLPAGGYICGITSVEDVANSEYLRFEYDIAEGEYKNYYRELSERLNFWGGSFIKSYKEKALGFFKKMIIAFEKSNPGFKFDNDEKTFRRKKIGLVLAEEEYVNRNSGEIKTRLYVADFLPVEDIKNGKFKVPSKKVLAKQSEAVKPAESDFEEIGSDDDDDLPF